MQFFLIRGTNEEISSIIFKCDPESIPSGFRNRNVNIATPLFFSESVFNIFGEKNIYQVFNRIGLF